MPRNSSVNSRQWTSVLPNAEGRAIYSRTLVWVPVDVMGRRVRAPVRVIVREGSARRDNNRTRNMISIGTNKVNINDFIYVIVLNCRFIL